MKLMVDKVEFKSKPSGNEIAQIQNRFKDENTLKEISVTELFDYIKKGYTFVPGVTKGGAKNENWEQQQVIFIDVDNDDRNNILTPKQAISKFKEKNIEVLGYYHTFSSTNEIPRYRLILLLDKPITEKSKMEFILKTLIDYIGGDNACKNLARIFYGTNGDEKEVILLNSGATITFDEIISLNNQIQKAKDYGNDLNKLVKKFDLLEYMKKDNNVTYISNDRVNFETCSICGHKDCLRYYPKTNSFYCFGKNGNTGGTIIEYLMATKNMDKKEAIEYFKHDILRLSDNQESKPDNFDILLKTVKNQIKSLGFPDNIVNEENFIWISENMKILCPYLADFFRKNVNYIFVKDRATHETLKYFYFNNYYERKADEEIRGIIKQFIPMPLQKSSQFNEVFNLLLTDLNFVNVDELNKENIINFQNGIFHIDTWKLEKHSPKYLSTIRIPCEYHEDVPTPETKYFDNFINTLTNGDNEIKKLLFQVMGVAISNVAGYRMKKAILMYGKGNTGKSVLKNFLTSIIGKENCTNIDLKELEDKFGKINLLHKRMAGSNDMSFVKIKELETFKQAVGGDLIHGADKFEKAIDFKFKGVFWFCANELPKFGGDQGDWVYDRFIVVECKNVIPNDKQDKELVEHLLEEKEYIVSLALKGLKEVIDNKYRYDIPQSCILLNEQYKIDNNSFRTFLQECCIDRVPGAKIEDTNCTKGKIHKVYKQWYKDNYRGGFYETTSEIKKILENMDKYHIIKTNNGNEYYKDFTLKEEIQREYKDLLGILDIPPVETIKPEDVGLEDMDELTF